MGSPFVVVCGARNVKTILTSEGELVTIKPSPASRPLFGEWALSNSTGRQHSEQYRVTRRAFNHQNLSQHNARIADMLHKRVTDWCRRRHIYAVSECKRLIFEIGSEVILGFKFGSAEAASLLEEFDVFATKFFSIPTRLPGSGFQRALKSRDRLVAILRAHKSSGVAVPCVIDMASRLDASTCDDSESAKCSVLYDQALELLFGMSETTASASAAMMTLLSGRHDVIARVRHEVEAALHGQTAELH